MRTTLSTLLFGAILPLVTAAPIAQEIADKYIITFNDGVDAASHTEWVNSVHRRNLARRGLTARQTVGIQRIYRRFPAYAGEFDAATIETIRASPDVKAVEADSIAYLDDYEIVDRATVDQSNSTYGLAQISHRAANTTGNSPEDYEYLYDESAGEGGYAYVLDTGVQINHTEFEGRASYGYNVQFPDREPFDDNGHGTHVSGTIASKTYGVSKKAQVIAVKVLVRASGMASECLEGYDWAINDAIEKGTAPRSVINMSLRFSDKSQAWNTAIRAGYDAGVTTVVSAGNARTDANSQAPAFVPECITVAASTSRYQQAAFSNYGPRVDVYAPGDQVLSTYFGRTPQEVNRTQILSGTSMASPHVAGLALYLQTLYGLSGAQDTTDKIVELATKDAITNPTTGTPNLLAFNGIGES